jgi:hypothetical protein
MRFARIALWFLARTLALIWLVPALVYNVDWTGHADWQANASAVIMILGAALFIVGAHLLRSWVLSPLCVVGAIWLMCANTQQATRTLGLGREAASELREGRILAASHLASQRSRLESRRAAQAEIAGEANVATLEIAVDELKVGDPKRWRDTNGCAPDKVTTSREFCVQVVQAKAKVAAAASRDQIDRELRALPTASTEVAEGVPKVADPHLANQVALLKEAGFNPTDRLIAAVEAIFRAAGFELLAALGPAVHLGLINFIAVGASSAVSRQKPMAKKPKADDAIAPRAPAKADAIDRWIADDLELHDGSFVYAKDLRTTPGWPADLPGINERMIWQRLKNIPGVKHDPNSGRPRYFGIRVRAKPKLAIVGGTRVS